jgi:hypothetical protein
VRTLASLCCSLLLAACGGPLPAVPAGLGIAVEDHFFEVPRTPAPGYRRDGALFAAVGERRPRRAEVSATRRGVHGATLVDLVLSRGRR